MKPSLAAMLLPGPRRNPREPPLINSRMSSDRYRQETDQVVAEGSVRPAGFGGRPLDPLRQRSTLAGDRESDL